MNKVALITGASSGIGKDFAHIHAEQGGDLIIVARTVDKLNDLKAELEMKHKINVLVLGKDLTETNAAKEVYQVVKEAGIKVNYLINNAGFGGIGAFVERDLESDLQMIQLNIVALTSSTHHFLKDFKERNSGRILNVSSTASLMPGPLQAVYFATKAYVTSFGNALWEELRHTNITVTTLMPGATETGFGERSGMNKTELFDTTADSRTVAEDGYNSMLRGELEIISGVSFPQKLMFKAMPFMPKKLLLSQVKKMQEVK